MNIMSLRVLSFALATVISLPWAISIFVDKVLAGNLFALIPLLLCVFIAYYMIQFAKWVTYTDSNEIKKLANLLENVWYMLATMEKRSPAQLNELQLPPREIQSKIWVVNNLKYRTLQSVCTVVHSFYYRNGSEPERGDMFSGSSSITQLSR